MKKIVLILQVCLLFQVFNLEMFASERSDKCQLEICTFNIRGDKAIDGQHQWKFRCDSVAQMLANSSLDVICLQEAKQFQLEDLLNKTNFAFVGIRGMHDPILFNQDRLELLHTETFWLSETSEPCSVGWDGKYDRYCTWAKFRDRKTSAEFFVFNTHLDHKGEIAQKEGAKLVSQKAKYFAGDTPFVVCGDMNIHDDSEAYATFVSYLKDSRSVALEVAGPEGTFHSFGRIAPFRIDFLFANDSMEILNYTVNDKQFANGVLPSDHYPVSIKVNISSKK